MKSYFVTMARFGGCMQAPMNKTRLTCLTLRSMAICKMRARMINLDITNTGSQLAHLLLELLQLRLVVLIRVHEQFSNGHFPMPLASAERTKNMPYFH